MAEEMLLVACCWNEDVLTQQSSPYVTNMLGLQYHQQKQPIAGRNMPNDAALRNIFNQCQPPVAKFH